MWCVKCGRQGKNESCDYCGGLMVDYNPKDKVSNTTTKKEAPSSGEGGYCLRCGKYSGKGHIVCPYCSGTLSKDPNRAKMPFEIGEDRTGTGIALCLLLGFVGLLIGYGLFKHGTRDRYTFLEGYVKAQIIGTIIAVAVVILLFFTVGFSFLAMLR